MAVVEPHRPYGFDRISVIRPVEFLGPVSPELVLVDAEFAAWARALLPEAPGAPFPRRFEGSEPIPLRTNVAPGRRRIRWRLVTASVVTTVAVAAAGFGHWVATGGNDDDSVRLSVAVPTVPSALPVERDPLLEEVVALEKAKLRQPRSRSIREALGITYFRLGRWQEAEAEFADLVALSPSDKFAHYALRLAQANQGRRKDATHFKPGTILAHAQDALGPSNRAGVQPSAR